jgi:hypothetical protein
LENWKLGKLETVIGDCNWKLENWKAKMATIIEVKNLFKIHSKLEIMMYTFQDPNKTVKSLPAKYDDLLLQFRSLNDKTQSCNQDKASIKKDLNGLSTCAVNASMQAEELAQYLRSDCLEISGTKATSTCSAEAIVKSVGKAIGVAVSQNDISITHPIPSYNRNAPPKIIVKFTRREVRNKFYSNRWNLAKKKVKDFPDL